ncbi:MAG: hypothetical protein ACI837_000811 [Crocinitomicaceae bacterium]|jgi:hypothetical protein
MSINSVDTILKTFESIGLDQMDNVKLMDRVDTKFVFRLEQLIEVLPELNKHYRVLSIKGKVISAYESLYYDNEDLDFYNDHHNKKLNRMKVRYRKYLDSDLAFLEVKHKYKGRTNKMRIQSDDLHMNMPSEHMDFVNDSVAFEDFRKLVPTLTNHYKRITLVGRNFNERLTIDLDLSFEWDGKKSELSHLVIAELKQSKVTRTSPFFSLMKRQFIRPLRLSKYCIGILHLDDENDIKYNRFKKKLLKIAKLKIYAA